MSFKVIGIGEAVWDLMPAGKQLGGAPVNFAYHARSFGADAGVVTRVGDDSFGREILERFKDMKIAAGLVQVDPAKPTGTVVVTLHDGGVPQFTISEDVAWDRLVPTDAAVKAVREADAVCFGSLAQRHSISRLAIQQLLAATPADALRMCDINLRQKFYSREIIEQSLRLANGLKLNDEELSILTGMFSLPGDVRRQISWLLRTFGLKLVVLTRGPRGSLIYMEDRWSEQPPQSVQVIDTVGAGDSFTAALVMGLLNKMDLDEVHAIAAEVARYVCSQAGATPRSPETFRSKFNNPVFLPEPEKAVLACSGEVNLKHD